MADHFLEFFFSIGILNLTALTKCVAIKKEWRRLMAVNQAILNQTAINVCSKQWQRLGGGGVSPFNNYHKK